MNNLHLKLHHPTYYIYIVVIYVFTSLCIFKLYIYFTIPPLSHIHCPSIYICKHIMKILEVYAGNTGTLGIIDWNKSLSGDSLFFSFLWLCVLMWAVLIFWWSLAVCLPPEAAPSASMINAAAYLPSLGSGVPFLLLYPAAPAAGTERTRTGLFLLQRSPWHHKPTTNREPTKPPKNQTTPPQKNPQTINQPNNHCPLSDILLTKGHQITDTARVATNYYF